jgi:hypothetical protein
MNKGLLTAQPQLLEECATYASGHKLIYRLISVQPALHSITDAARPLRLLGLVPNRKSHNAHSANDRFAPKAAFEDLRTARCALSRGRPFRSPCRASENSSWGGPQNDASRPASTRASTICRRELLPLGPAPWQITSYPWGYTRGLHRQTRACKKALFYGAFSKPF